MPRMLNFYMDDSGTRAPNREPLPYNKNAREFFALGGVLIDEEAEAAARKLCDEFRARWFISYPLHSVEIRHHKKRFLWLGRDRSERDKFMKDLSRTLPICTCGRSLWLATSQPTEPMSHCGPLVD